MGYLADFSYLFFPSYCAGCGYALYKNENTLCLKCLIALPRAGIHDFPGNKLEKIFWGRAHLESVSAFLYMPRHGMAHRLMHELKYRNNPELGVHLGKLFGLELSDSVRMNSFDAIIPVPLHPKKFQKRGYNQSACIAQGIAESLGSIVILDNLCRRTDTATQTKKSRYQRWENVSDIFAVERPEELAGKRLLLIDDVITTGSTIEGCAEVLKNIPGVILSVAALAIPVH
ncbi:MAG: ComF family protein [Crocinitomicaceae bacterium]|nr:ComF family protein [Crocinitomicaceae bacterium]